MSWPTSTDWPVRTARGSEFIERVLRQFVREHADAKAQTHDLRRINQAAARLNAEASDVLDYQFSKG